MRSESVAMWLRALLRRERVEDEMAREMRAHIEIETDANMRAGMSPADARRAALLAFGGVESNKESVRDERVTRWLEHLVEDVRYALRSFRRSPGTTAVIIGLLALGVGANAAMFGVIHRVLINPMPYPDGKRMVEVVATSGQHRLLVGVSKQTVLAWQSRARASESIVLMDSHTYTLGDASARTPDLAEGVSISPSAMAFAGAKPLIGRDLVVGDTAHGAPPVVLLGYRLWQQRFAASPEVLGRTLRINGRDHQIVGVMPEGFTLPFQDNRDLFVAMQEADSNEVGAFAKVQTGFTLEDATRELVDSWRLATPFGRRELSDPPQLVRGADQVSASVRDTVVLLFAAVGVVLLIACANVANLLLGRQWTRRREFAVRAAIGADRGRLVRQVMTESLTLAVAGGVAGLVVAFATVRALSALQPTYMQQMPPVQFSAAVWSWAFGISLLCGLVFGVAPAWSMSESRLDDALKSGDRGASPGALTRRLRAGLVVTEVALSVTLIVCVGLLARSIVEMSNADFGMESRGLYGVFVRLPRQTFTTDAVRIAAFEAILERTKGEAGLGEVTYAHSLPPRFIILTMALRFEGSEGDTVKSLFANSVRPNFFRLTGTPIVAGQTFSSNWTVDDSKPLDGDVIVSSALAKHFWPDGQAIGKRINWWQFHATVVGVAKDVVVPGQTKPGDDWQVYFPATRNSDRGYIIVRSTLPMASVVASVKRAIKESVPGATIDNGVDANRRFVAARAQQRFLVGLVGAFAAIALILAIVGLHAVIAFNVRQRMREFGIRVALGAQSADVVRSVLGSGARLATCGVVIGVVGAVFASRLINSLLYGVTGSDPITMAGTGVVVIACSLLASYAPTRLALRADPVEILRAE